jgi:MoaA/NifB/PqqE/SkfB family radical SAM enzyme
MHRHETDPMDRWRLPAIRRSSGAGPGPDKMIVIDETRPRKDDRGDERLRPSAVTATPWRHEMFPVLRYEAAERTIDRRARETPTLFIYIDSFTMCNLRCPSCAVGDYNRSAGRPLNTRRMMTPQTLGLILDKALREIQTIEGIGFFNWTEPLLHPRIAELVAEVSGRGLMCWISSNLNVLRDPDALLTARPHEIIVSVSGFHQDVYQRGHAGGDIEAVKSNMVRLADAEQNTRSETHRTWLRLVYHRYADNADDEREMQRYAESLGFVFSPTWAYVTSVERVLDLHTGARQFKEDDELMERLALPFAEAMRLVSKTPAQSCAHIGGRLVLDSDANVYLCCASSAAATNLVGNFLTTPLAELQSVKGNHPLCGPCMKHSVMTYFDRASDGDAEFSELAVARRPGHS